MTHEESPRLLSTIGFALGRAVVGALAGAVSCLTFIAWLGTALYIYPPDDVAGSRLFLLVVGVGGTGGASLGVVFGGRQISGRAKSIIICTLAGCLLGLLGGVLYAAIMASVHGFSMWGKFGAGYRFAGLSVGVPAGSLLGCVVGAFWRRKSTPTSPPGGLGHDS